MEITTYIDILCGAFRARQPFNSERAIDRASGVARTSSNQDMSTRMSVRYDSNACEKQITN